MSTFSSGFDIQQLRLEVKDLQIELENADRRMRYLESRVLTVMSLTRTFCGSDEVTIFIDWTLRALAVAQALHAALIALQVARMAAGDPTAWIGFGVATATFGISVFNMMELRRPTY